MNNKNFNRQLDFIDLLQILSFWIDLINLSQNKEQIEYDIIEQSNSNQLERLVRELDKRFEQQNAMLQAILEKIGRP